MNGYDISKSGQRDTVALNDLVSDRRNTKDDLVVVVDEVEERHDKGDRACDGTSSVRHKIINKSHVKISESLFPRAPTRRLPRISNALLVLPDRAETVNSEGELQKTSSSGSSL